MTVLQTKKDLLLDFFERKLPAFYKTDVIRQSQVQMTMDVAAFLQRPSAENIMFVEAPVGTGKSLGVLAPALVEARAINKRVLYATSSINLQSQLMHGEVPLLQSFDLLGETILAKGKSHYYCHAEYEKRRGRYQTIEGQLGEFFASALTGHREEFEERFGRLSDSDWNGLCLREPRRVCTRCEHSLYCPTNLHRRNFLSNSNELVITNHDQLIRSCLNHDSEYQSPIVPVSPGIVIIDEAHDFQTNFLGQLTKTITVGTLRALSGKLPKDLQRSYRKFLRNLEKLLIFNGDDGETNQGRYPLSREVAEVVRNIRGVLKESFYREVAQVGKGWGVYDDIEAVFDDLSVIDNDDYVSWLDYEERSLCSVSRMFPQDFRRLIGLLTWRNKVIVMSGTLTADGDFREVLQQWRLPKNVANTLVPPSFSYDQQALIYTPTDLVSPKNEDKPYYLQNQIEHIEKLVRITHGRTLILATSKTHMNQVYNGLLPNIADTDINVLLQGTNSTEYLTEQFKADEQSILIGTGSFFSGFSVPGRALVSVIITKLPFPVPGDPYLKLVNEGLEDLQDDIYLSEMLVKLKQAIGRLIRDISDFGVVTILDPRIYTRKYGPTVRSVFTKLGYRFTRSEQEVTEFLEAYLGQGAHVQYQPYARDQLTIDPALDSVPNPKSLRSKPVQESPSQRTSTKKTSPITKEQRAFYKRVHSIRNIERRKIFKSQKQLYEYLFDLYHDQGESTEFVETNFPFESEEQRKTFLDYKGRQNSVKRYFLSQEELEKYRNM